MYEIKRATRMSQNFVHFVIARASLFTDHKISSLPIRARYKRFRTICEQTVDNSPTDSFSSSLSWWSSMHGNATLKNCWIVLCASSQYLLPQFHYSFDPLFECNPNKHGQERMLVLQINGFRGNVPSRFHVFCSAGQFDIVQIHWWE